MNNYAILFLCMIYVANHFISKGTVQAKQFDFKQFDSKHSNKNNI